MEKWRVLESHYLYKSPYGSVREDKCLLPDGTVIDNYRTNEYCDWVNVVALTKQRDLVLVRQYRHGANGIFLEIPAGSVEEGEHPADAALRELREETGFTSEFQPLELGNFFTNPCNANNRVHTYLITDAERRCSQALDGSESIEIVICPLKDVHRLIQQKTIDQLFTIAAVLLAEQYLVQRRD